MTLSLGVSWPEVIHMAFFGCKGEGKLLFWVRNTQLNCHVPLLRRKENGCWGGQPAACATNTEGFKTRSYTML